MIRDGEGEERELKEKGGSLKRRYDTYSKVRGVFTAASLGHEGSVVNLICLSTCW